MTIFGILNELFSPQNVNLARFARIVNKTFSRILKHCKRFESRVRFKIISGIRGARACYETLVLWND